MKIAALFEKFSPKKAILIPRRIALKKDVVKRFKGLTYYRMGEQIVPKENIIEAINKLRGNGMPCIIR